MCVCKPLCIEDSWVHLSASHPVCSDFTHHFSLKNSTVWARRRERKAKAAQHYRENSFDYVSPQEGSEDALEGTTLRELMSKEIPAHHWDGI